MKSGTGITFSGDYGVMCNSASNLKNYLDDDTKWDIVLKYFPQGSTVQGAIGIPGLRAAYEYLYNKTFNDINYYSWNDTKLSLPLGTDGIFSQNPVYARFWYKWMVD